MRSSKARAFRVVLILVVAVETRASLLEYRMKREEEQDSVSILRPLLKRWNDHAYSKRLIVVIENDLRSAVVRPILTDVFTRSISTVQLFTLPNVRPLHDPNIIEAHCVLLFFTSTSNLRDVVEERSFPSFWHPKNFYVLRKIKLHDRPDDESSRLLRYLPWALSFLWQRKRIYRVIASIGENFARFDPFVDSVAVNRTNSRVRGAMSLGKDLDFIDEDYVLASRRDYDGYPLKISIFETVTMIRAGDSYEGVDGNLVRVVCERMNATPSFVLSQDSFGWSSGGVFTGALADLVYGRADVSFNQFFVKNYFSENIDTATYVFSDEMCVLVPAASPVPLYLIVVRVFTIESWALIIVGHVVLSLVYIVVKEVVADDETMETSRSEDRRKKASSKCPEIVKSDSTASARIAQHRQSGGKENVLLGENRSLRLTMSSIRFKCVYPAPLIKYTMKFLLQIIQPLETARPRLPERLVLICSLITSLILNGIFTSQLTSHFNKRSYFENAHTLQELSNIGLPILSSSMDLLQDARSSGDSFGLQSLNLQVEYANSTEQRRRLFVMRNAAVLERKRDLWLKFKDEDFSKMHSVEECPKMFIIAPLVRKGSPFLNRINDIIGRLNNGGIFVKWFRDMFLSRMPEDDVKKHNDKHCKLTLSHFYIPFVILLIGLSSSFIIFAYECRGFRRTSTNN